MGIERPAFCTEYQIEQLSKGARPDKTMEGVTLPYSEMNIVIETLDSYLFMERNK
jgi:hypothetical protein